MSTLKADTIVASDGSSPVTLTKQEAAKARCSIDGDSTVNDSLNIASTTDNGNGDNTYTFSNAMGNATFAVSGMAKSEDTAGVRSAYLQFVANNTSIATTFFRLDVQYSNGNVRESSYVSTIAHGDLA